MIQPVTNFDDKRNDTNFTNLKVPSLWSLLLLMQWERFHFALSQIFASLAMEQFLVIEIGELKFGSNVNFPS
jgi:hypothetical protein